MIKLESYDHGCETIVFVYEEDNDTMKDQDEDVTHMETDPEAKFDEGSAIELSTRDEFIVDIFGNIKIWEIEKKEYSPDSTYESFINPGYILEKTNSVIHQEKDIDVTHMEIDPETKFNE